MPTIGVLLIVKNEADKLESCLDSVSGWVDQIVILDSGSTDATLDIASRYTRDIHINKKWPGFGKQRQLAQSYLTTDWVFAIDADEIVSDSLRLSILAALEKGDCVLYQINRLSSAFGKKIRYSGWSPDRVVRLYPRLKAAYNDDLVHEKVVSSEAMDIKKLDGFLFHDTYQDLHHYSVKTTEYLKAWADDREDKKSSSVSKALLHAFACFIRMYVLKRGFLDGKHGFILAWLATHSTFYKYIDLWLRKYQREK